MGWSNKGVLLTNLVVRDVPPTWMKSWLPPPPPSLSREHSPRQSAELSSSSPKRSRAADGGTGQDRLLVNLHPLPRPSCHHHQDCPSWVHWDRGDREKICIISRKSKSPLWLLPGWGVVPHNKFNHTVYFQSTSNLLVGTTRGLYRDFL